MNTQTTSASVWTVIFMRRTGNLADPDGGGRRTAGYACGLFHECQAMLNEWGNEGYFLDLNEYIDLMPKSSGVF